MAAKENSQKINIVLTEDGSPTAFFNDFEGEKMHHSGGAFGESVYIFGPALMWAFSQVDQGKLEKPRIVSVGTGLGYNEIISAAMAMVFACDFTLDSFEKSEDLNKSLKNWLLENNEKSPVDKSVYDVILKMTGELFDLDSQKIKKTLQEKYQNGEWRILGEVPPLEKLSPYNVILYDLFSSKAMGAFWSEEYLSRFLAQTKEDICAFASYACTGNLKRALKKNNFLFTQRVGYLWKRNSTFATSNIKGAGF
jgi:hypothetical protein